MTETAVPEAAERPGRFASSLALHDRRVLDGLGPNGTAIVGPIARITMYDVENLQERSVNAESWRA